MTIISLVEQLFELRTPITKEILVDFPAGLVLVHPDSIDSEHPKNWYGSGPKLEEVLLEQSKIFIDVGLPVVTYCYQQVPEYLDKIQEQIKIIWDTQYKDRFGQETKKIEQAFNTGARNIARYLSEREHNSVYLGGVQFEGCVKYMGEKLSNIGISSRVEVQLTDGR